MISGSVNTSSGSSAYASSMVYDHLGRRAALSESLGSGGSLKKDVQFYIFDGNDLVYRQFTGTNGITALDGSDVTNDNGVLYLYGPTGLIMEFDRFGSYRTLLFDPQGNNVSSTKGLTYYGGTITGTTWFPVFYDRYGSQVWNPPNGSSPTKLNRATSQPFQYKGQYGYYTDGATGLDYCINRYYDPLSGRWLSRDPRGLDGGVNVYQYCDGDPVLGADPTGLDGVVVYGDDTGVPGSRLGFELNYPLGPLKIYSKPSKELVMHLLCTMPADDYFYFWGHGSGSGSIWVNEKETITINDVAWADLVRKHRGLQPISEINLHACDTVSTMGLVNTWLTLGKQVQGYPGLTAEGPWYNFRFNPQLTFTHPINYDPGRSSGVGHRRKKDHD